MLYYLPFNYIPIHPAVSSHVTPFMCPITEQAFRYDIHNVPDFVSTLPFPLHRNQLNALPSSYRPFYSSATSATLITGRTNIKLASSTYFCQFNSLLLHYVPWSPISILLVSLHTFPSKIIILPSFYTPPILQTLGSALSTYTLKILIS